MLLTVLTVVNMVLLLVLTVVACTLLAELFSHRRRRQIDIKRLEIEADRRKVEHALIAAILCRLDNFAKNMSQWFESSTGQRWVDVPRDDIMKKMRAIEKMVEDMQMDDKINE